jgi:hypothetical protein
LATVTGRDAGAKLSFWNDGAIERGGVAIEGYLEHKVASPAGKPPWEAR